jgi:hypothetical protein
VRLARLVSANDGAFFCFFCSKQPGSGLGGQETRMRTQFQESALPIAQ